MFLVEGGGTPFAVTQLMNTATASGGRFSRFPPATETDDVDDGQDPRRVEDNHAHGPGQMPILREGMGFPSGSLKTRFS